MVNRNSKTDRKFQSTPPSREATSLHEESKSPYLISIHAPLTGGDATVRNFIQLVAISIHAPLTGGDVMWMMRDVSIF